MLPLDRTWWDGWQTRQGEDGIWDVVVMKCCMREKLGDVWTGRIESVTCPCNVCTDCQSTAAQSSCSDPPNPTVVGSTFNEWQKTKENHSLCKLNLEGPGVWWMSDHCLLVTKV